MNLKILQIHLSTNAKATNECLIMKEKMLMKNQHLFYWELPHLTSEFRLYYFDVLGLSML